MEDILNNIKKNGIEPFRKDEFISKSEAYEIVFDDLMQHNLFKGIYDAKNGREDFMYDIATVMECIALGVSDECYDMFQSEWTKNIITSEEKAKWFHGRTGNKTED